MASFAVLPGRNENRLSANNPSYLLSIMYVSSFKTLLWASGYVYTTRFFCVDCLAAYFAVTPDDIRERIAYFKASGCTLFSTVLGGGGQTDAPSF